MKVTKVTFSKKIGMPGYSSDNPGVEVELEGKETKEEAWTKLNQDMIAWHRAEYTHLYDPPAEKRVFVTDAPEREPRSKQPEDQRIAALISDIYSCSELKVLEGYRLLAKTKPELQAAYDMQYTKLNLPKPQTND
jgi:hypothetical protein